MAGILGSLIARGGFAITPSATALVTTYGSKAYGLDTGSGGDFTVTTEDGDVLTYTAQPANRIIPVVITHVTASTATGIKGYKATT